MSGVTARHSRDEPGEPGSSPWDPGRCRPDPAGGWHLAWVPGTGSTNADLVADAARGAPDRSVLVADLQTAGRGRLGRSWQAPAGRALTFSVLLRPRRVPAQLRGWIGALLSLAVAAGVSGRTGLVADLKWPNDVLIEERKVAGVLAEMTGSSPAGGPALVAGAGINVTLGSGDLPRPDATSLWLSGADPAACGREELLAAVLDALGPLLDRWQQAGGDVHRSGLREEYLARCRTIGTEVTIRLPDGGALVGRAVDVTAEGAIVIDDGARRHRFAAGDVHHLRPAR